MPVLHTDVGDVGVSGTVAIDTGFVVSGRERIVSNGERISV